MLDIEDFKKKLEKKSRLMGIDPGKKRVGIAISDENKIIATPYTTILRDRYSEFLKEIKKIVDENQIKGIVIGNPINMDGSSSQSSQSAKDLAINLSKDITENVTLWDEVKRRILIGTYVLSSGYYDAYYIKAQKVRQLIKNDFDQSFKKVDAILTPSTPSAAFKIGEKKNDPISMYLNDIFTVPVNLAGIPAISIPAGFDKSKYPLGLQLIGNTLEEQKLLNIAFAAEKKINFKQDLNKWWEK